MPLDGIREFLRGATRARGDACGVQPRDLFCADDGRVFYVVSAPDEDTVRQHHAALGVICRRVRCVQSLRAGADGLSEEIKAVVRRMIAAEPAGSISGWGWTAPDDRLSQAT